MVTSRRDNARKPNILEKIPGWFYSLDQLLFDWLLTRQEEGGECGDLLEIGAYLGKSAIFMGRHVRAGEAFTVCDLFDSSISDEANAMEMSNTYSTLTRREFEKNYLAFHDALPMILQIPSSELPGKVAPRSCRFVHIDGSHLYRNVYQDIGTAHEVLLPEGIVVLDDIREEHTPGVTIAAWEAVLNRGLRPICLSSKKLYGTWGNAQAIQTDLLDMLDGRNDCELLVQNAAGHRIICIRSVRDDELRESDG